MMGLLSSIGKGIAKVLDTATVAIAHPVKTATALVSDKSTVKEVIQEHFSQPLSTQLKQTILGTVGIAATVVTAGKVGAAAKAGTLVKSITPTTIKGKVITAVAAPLAVGAVINQPKKVAEAILKTPASLVNVGGNISNLIADPSVSNVKKLVTENPVIVGAALALGTIATAKTLIPAVTAARQIEATQEQTEAIKSATAGITAIPITTPAFTNEGVMEAQPQTPQTKTITSGSTKTRRRKASRIKEKTFGNINQRVNVIVSNRSSSTGIRSSKRYLNREILLN